MFDPILSGISFGFVLSFLVGPIFFILIETSLKKGIKPAIALDLGVLWSDIIYIVLAFFFANQILNMKKHEDTLLMMGGGTFVIIGLVHMLRVKKESAIREEEIIVARKDYVKYFIKGFVLNMINPSVFFYWCALLIVANNRGYSGLEMLLFFASIVVSFFTIDFLKILGAARLKNFMTYKRLKSINRVTGFILILSGLGMILKGSGVLNFS